MLLWLSSTFFLINENRQSWVCVMPLTLQATLRTASAAADLGAPSPMGGLAQL